jgi:hypothetical protein
VPKTLSKQIDTKVGTWKTTYDVYNEAPYRPEPVRKFKSLFKNKEHFILIEFKR